MIKKITTGKNAGKYLVRIQPRDKITGKRINLPCKYADTKLKAVHIEKEMWAKYEAGISISTGNDIFAEAFQKYVDKRASSISPVTLKAWQDTANAIKRYFKNAKINQITTSAISDFAHDYVNKHNATVRKSSVIAKRLTHMRNFFSTLEGKSLEENPVPERALKTFFQQSDFSVPDEWYIFTSTELDKMREHILKEIKDAPIGSIGSKLAILIESYTGMRIGELQALKYSDIVFENGVWTFKINDSWSDYARRFNGALKARPQGATRTVLPIPEDIIKVIKSYQLKQNHFLEEYGLSNPLNLLFINLHDYKYASNREPIKQKSINMMLASICGKLDIKSNGKRLSMYSFRHTICTNLANTPGMSYPWASERMGHSLSMFMRTYVGVDRDINKQMLDLWAK